MSDSDNEQKRYNLLLPNIVLYRYRYRFLLLSLFNAIALPNIISLRCTVFNIIIPLVGDICETNKKICIIYSIHIVVYELNSVREVNNHFAKYDEMRNISWNNNECENTRYCKYIQLNKN
jgi:hypothetical protein